MLHGALLMPYTNNEEGGTKECQPYFCCNEVREEHMNAMFIIISGKSCEDQRRPCPREGVERGAKGRRGNTRDRGWCGMFWR